MGPPSRLRLEDGEGCSGVADLADELIEDGRSFGAQVLAVEIADPLQAVVRVGSRTFELYLCLGGEQLGEHFLRVSLSLGYFLRFTGGAEVDGEAGPVVT